ncbi:hypothetical protein B7494_g6051 [Chlorociboria aeruginascens]|nr:hypothetical protein B7494_g6051 [Chlorociboria aeruginascens]
MVSIKDVRSSNASFKELKKPGLVAVFVGATRGIGMGTLKQFTKNAYQPTIYIVGRSKRVATPLLTELEASNQHAEIIFIETEVSLIKNVDITSGKIKSVERKVDILFMTVGYLATGGRQETSEELDAPHALRYYTRLRFVYNFLPLLAAAPTPRVISILAAGKEASIDLWDLELRKEFNSMTAAGNGATQTTLAFEELAKTYPSISFIHKYPGFVNTGAIDRLLGTVKGTLALPAMFARWFVLPVANAFSMSVDEAGERGLFLATSARFPSAEPKEVGVELPDGVEVAKSSVVKDGKGNGVYRLDQNDESVPDGDVLPNYRAKNVGQTVWKETLATWRRSLY